MIKTLTFLLLLTIGNNVLFAKPITKGKKSQDVEIKMGKNWQISNGVLKISGNHKSLRNVVFKLPKCLKILKLKCRIKRISAPAKGDQFGFLLSGTGAEAFRLYSNPHVGFFHILSKNGKTVSHKHLRPRMKLPPLGDASPWQTIELEANSKGVQVTVDGKALEFKSCNVFPLNTIILYAYALDMELDDLSISGVEDVSGNVFNWSKDFSKAKN